MFKVVERKIKQSLDSIEDELKGCAIVVRLADNSEDEGYLMAYRTSIETSKELCDYISRISKKYTLFVGGMYEEGDAFYIPH